MNHFLKIALISICLGIFGGGLLSLDCTTAWALNSPTEVIKDANGRIMGRFQAGKVYNENGKLLGYYDKHGTYDSNHRKISMNEIPGILFCR